MKTPLITREGYETLKQELNYLWREERPEVTKKVTWAASLGDRSENADYQYNKKRLREIDRRVRYLTKCMENLKIVDYSPQQEGKVLQSRGLGDVYKRQIWRWSTPLSAKQTGTSMRSNTSNKTRRILSPR